MIRKFLHQLIANDSDYADWVHLVGVLSALAFILYAGYALIVHKQWDPQAYGTGFGAMAAGLGALLWGKAKKK